MPKDKYINIRVTEEEKEQIKVESKKNGFDKVGPFSMWVWRKFFNSKN